MLQLLIKAMREYAENLTGRAFISRTLRLNLPCYPLDSDYGIKVVLPRPPFQSLVSVKYVDTNGDLQDLTASLYAAHTEYEPGFIIPTWASVWPVLRAQPNALRVVYIAGYFPGSPQDEAGSQEVVPAAVKLWMQARLATLFKQREQLITGTIVAAIPRDFADGILDSLITGDRLW